MQENACVWNVTLLRSGTNRMHSKANVALPAYGVLKQVSLSHVVFSVVVVEPTPVELTQQAV